MTQSYTSSKDLTTSLIVTQFGLSNGVSLPQKSRYRWGVPCWHDTLDLCTLSLTEQLTQMRVVGALVPGAARGTTYTVTLSGFALAGLRPRSP